MTDPAPSPPPPASLSELRGRMADDLARLDTELSEIDLLVTQARTEATRHETRRVAAADKLSAAPVAAESAGGTMEPTVAAELNAQLVLLTKRAALMESQVDVLEEQTPCTQPLPRCPGREYRGARRVRRSTGGRQEAEGG
jgi:hypothetical protein